MTEAVEKSVPKMKILKGTAKSTEAVDVSAGAPVDTTAVTTAEAKPKKTLLKGKTVELTVTNNVVAKDTPQADVIGEDYLAYLDQKSNSMTSEEAFKLVPQLLNRVDQTYFELGGVLARIQSESWYADKGYENFRSYVESEGGMQYRKAMYLVSIYANLTQSGVSWSSVSSLGWTILKDLAQYLTPENVDEWVEAVKNMTVLEAQAYINAKTSNTGAGNNSDAATDAASTALTTVSFKVHQDQKITIKDAVAKNKKESGTEFDSVALENICLDYLAGPAPKTQKAAKPLTLVEMLGNAGVESAIDAFNTAFAEAKLELSQVE